MAESNNKILQGRRVVITRPRDQAVEWRKKLESLGAECFMGKDQGHGKGFFEIKFKGPDGTVFDIAGHPWMGAKGLEG